MTTTGSGDDDDVDVGGRGPHDAWALKQKPDLGPDAGVRALVARRY